MNDTSLLLVDDEAALVDLLKKYLERLGFQVRTYTDPHAAVRVFEAEPHRFSLVVADLTLPGMSGEEMVERMRAFRPGLPAIIASGYAYRPRAHGIEFLQKPFLPKTLADAIHRILKVTKS